MHVARHEIPTVIFWLACGEVLLFWEVPQRSAADLSAGNHPPHTQDPREGTKDTMELRLPNLLFSSQMGVTCKIIILRGPQERRVRKPSVVQLRHLGFLILLPLSV